MRVLVHCQHLSGAGHFVRSHEIATELARAHDVRLTDGGRPVPRPPDAARVRRLALAPLERRAGRVTPIERGADLDAIFARRRETLLAEVDRAPPDVVLVEHYPFGKWDLADEIHAVIDAARRARPSARAVCSVRDVCVRTRHEPVDDASWAAAVRARLAARFDAVLVHTDPRLTRLQDHVPAEALGAVPVEATGIVSQRVPEVGGAAGSAPSAPEGPAEVVLSTGGGAEDRAFAGAVVRAWTSLARADAHGGRRLVVYAGAFADAAARAALGTALPPDLGEVRAFDVDFLSRLSRADASISRAGYNTCANLLETRRRALLVPDPRMSDQRFRARRLADLDLALALDPEEVDVSTLADAITELLRRDPPRHDLALDGAARTRGLLERLVARHVT